VCASGSIGEKVLLTGPQGPLRKLVAPLKRLRIGSLYRYARPNAPDIEVLDGIPNFYYMVSMAGMPTLQLERGINVPASTRSVDGDRVGVILLSSNENKLGSVENPWHDTISPDDGFARYFGDNRTPEVDPGTAQGNRNLLKQFDLHVSPLRDKRELAAPILVFTSSRKGYKEFAGLAVLTGAKRVTQYSEANGGYFTNYLFDLAILSLSQEDESVAMSWIEARRNGSLSASAANSLAPISWLNWIKFGSAEIEALRRRVTRYHILSKKQQLAPEGSEKRKVIEQIYGFYDQRKHRFEALASIACESMVKSSGASYHRGWLTRSSADGGLDFVGRMDVGEGLSRTKLVVLGQAKCEKIDVPTNGVHVARTVARLRRGWLGAYVTTSFFSEPVQREIYEDQYPVMLLNGSVLADEVSKLQRVSGMSLHDFLLHVDSTYEEEVSSRKPEEILWD